MPCSTSTDLPRRRQWRKSERSAARPRRPRATCPIRPPCVQGSRPCRPGRAPIDILVNNAGIARLGSLLTISDKDWRDTFAVNVDGVFNVTRAVVPGMVERKRGAVVNLASWLGRRGHPAFSAYAATKFAVVGMTQSLAPEVAPHGVRVNAVCPGLIGGTPMRDALDATSQAAGLPRAEERAKSIPLGRIGTPEDVAKVVAFLASDEAAYVTGACYDVTGGMWMT